MSILLASERKIINGLLYSIRVIIKTTNRGINMPVFSSYYRRKTNLYSFTKEYLIALKRLIQKKKHHHNKIQIVIKQIKYGIIQLFTNITPHFRLKLSKEDDDLVNLQAYA